MKHRSIHQAGTAMLALALVLVAGLLRVRDGRQGGG